MVYSISKSVIISIFLVTLSTSFVPAIDAASSTIAIIMGSTRQGRFSSQLGKALEAIAFKKNISVEIIDLHNYPLPFLDEATLPAERTRFPNEAIKNWSEKIDSMAGFVILCPEYNAGYPGVLKNAIDSLYNEWTKKPVGLISYSSGLYAGSGALAQLKQVVERIYMEVVPTTISIPTIATAFTSDGNFIDESIVRNFEQMLDQLIAAQK